MNQHIIFREMPSIPLDSGYNSKNFVILLENLVRKTQQQIVRDMRLTWENVSDSKTIDVEKVRELLAKEISILEIEKSISSNTQKQFDDIMKKNILMTT